jgi:TRAP-type mannitol/chloroaromatic compound transport system substrate-binding protein
VVQAQAQIRWRLASSFPKALDTIYGAAEVFSKKVAEMTGGKFQISVHPGGELMPALGVVDGVQNATVEMAHTCGYYFFGKDETFAIGCAIPFGLNSRQMTAWQYEGNGLKLMREFYRNYNIVHFPMGNTGAQMGGWYRKELKSVADVKGLKMRIGGFSGRVLQRMGGVPQNIPGGEIYQALEKGTIDAAEWVGPYDDLKLGFFKVAPFYHYPGWWEGGPQEDLYINTKAWDGLSAEYKAIVESAAAYAHTDMQAKYDGRNPAALTQLLANKTRLVQMPLDVLDLAFKESMALYSELSAKNPNWKKVYSDYAAFRKESNRWFRYTEAIFDRYMQNKVNQL